jgi:hypothetical protein
VLKALEATSDDSSKNDSAKSFSGPSEAKDDALVRMVETALASDPRPVSGGERHEVVVHVDAATLAR